MSDRISTTFICEHKRFACDRCGEALQAERDAAKGLVEALEHYAEKCDACGHEPHEFSCSHLASLGWTKGMCGCNYNEESVAEAALDAYKGK